LARFSKNIVVNFDPDTAGAAATDRSLAMLVEEDFNIKVMRLETGFDPDLFIRRNGVDAYRKALQASTKYFDYLINRAISMFPVRTPEGKVKAVNYLLPHIQKVPSRIVREGLSTDLAQKLGIDSAVLRQELKSAATRRSSGAIRTGGEMQVTPSEKVLIRAASSMAPEAADLRRTALDAMLAERLHAGLATESLLEALLHAGEHQDDPMALPLSDLDRQLLARIIMTEDVPVSPELLQQALEALRHRAGLAQRERDIKREFSEAERRNDVMTLVRLKQEKLELDRKLAASFE
jgi:DNA primase